MLFTFGDLQNLSRERAFSLAVLGRLAERTFVALHWLRVIKRKEGCDTSTNYLFCSFQLFVLLYIGIFLSLMKTWKYGSLWGRSNFTFSPLLAIFFFRKRFETFLQRSLQLESLGSCFFRKVSQELIFILFFKGHLATKKELRVRIHVILGWGWDRGYVSVLDGMEEIERSSYLVA